MRVKFGGIVPVPVRVLVCGEPVALSAKESVALKLPVAEGVKVMAMEQDAEATSASPQVFVPMAKSLALEPASVMPEIERVALPLLVRVNVLAALLVPLLTLPKSAAAGVSAAMGAAGAVAVPLSVEVCTPTASVTDRLAA